MVDLSIDFCGSRPTGEYLLVITDECGIRLLSPAHLVGLLSYAILIIYHWTCFVTSQLTWGANNLDYAIKYVPCLIAHGVRSGILKKDEQVQLQGQGQKNIARNRTTSAQDSFF